MDLTKQIKEEQAKTLQVLEDAHRLRVKEDQRTQEAKAEEEAKFREFQEIVRGQRYFRQAHIDALGIPYNICIHLSAKGSGKTTEIYRIMTKVVKAGEKFLYGRVYVSELLNELTEFQTDKRCPVTVVTFKGVPYFFDKRAVEAWAVENMKEDGVLPSPTFKRLISDGLEPCGRGYTFFGSNSLTGGMYEGYTTIFFDEILSYSPINRISDTVLHAWSASIHTIQRNKPDIRVYMMGNMQNVPEHPILAFYGIDISDSLRIIRRGERGETVILFINSGGLYGNTIGNKGGAAHHAGVEEQLFLKHNRVIKPATTILTPDIFNSLTHCFAFAVDPCRLAADVMYVEFREAQLEGGEIIGAAKCGKLELSTVMPSEIWTQDMTVFNRFHNTHRRETIEGLFNQVYRLFKFRALYFDTVNSLEQFSELVKMCPELIYENQPLPAGLQL